MQTAMTAIGAERGFFVPVCDDYLRKKMMKKMERLSLSSKIRIEMLKVLCDKKEGLDVSDYEVKNKDSIHTYKTLNYFKNTYPEADIYFLNGADKLTSIPKWNNAEELVRDIRFVLFDRADLDANSIIKSIPLLNEFSDHFTILPATDEFSDVSSSKIREMFENGDSGYRALMDKNVADVLASVNLGEYPIPTVYDWIGMSLQGGPFDKARGYKKVYELNKEVFKEATLSDMQSGTKMLEKLSVPDICFSETNVVHFDDEFNDLVGKLKEKGCNPVIISEACFSRVCGGYDQGKADALEEELCRISTLSQSLYQFGSPKLKCVKESCVDWKENVYPLNVGDGFYSPSVEFVRYGAKQDYREIDIKDRNKCDIISVASLDFAETHKENHLVGYTNAYGGMNESGKALYKSMLCKAFDYAIATSHDAVIINAFGGGYHLPLADVGEVMRDVFNLYNGKLKQIVVKEKDSKKYKEFYNKLGVR